jgi:hypothetical protein
MNLNQENLEDRCKNICKLREIKNSIVVLCEGDIVQVNGRLSPQSYRKSEQFPDANFYAACVPRWWKQQRPKFFPCGSRQDVLNTFFRLLELHNEIQPDNSYLSSNKLFAIVDLDVQIACIKNNDLFDNTDKIFYDLYDQFQVNAQNSVQHRIWITGLIHKEAYFLTPETKVILNNYYINKPNYKSSVLELEKIYEDMVDEICYDADLNRNSQTAFDRIRHCSNLNFDQITMFQQSWKSQYNTSSDTIDKKRLILALLTIVKAKSYWKNIRPPIDSTLSEQVFRDNLSLEIGKFYSEQDCDNVENHIPFFFKTLYKSIEAS